MKPSLAWWAALLLALAWLTPAHAADRVVYYHTDALRSVTVMTNEQGQVIERSYHAPYGAVLKRPLRDGPGYGGHQEDAGTGLVYMQQRYYDPEVGRFLSADPVQADPNTGDNFNRYWYANANPYTNVDPDGRCAGSLLKDCSFVTSPTLVMGSTTGSGGSTAPISQLQVLHKNVAVQYERDVTTPARSLVSKALTSAAKLLNANEKVLTANEIHAIHQMQAILITAAAKALIGQIGHTMRLSVDYIRSVSTPWLASIFGHEGRHFLDMGWYSGSNLWLGERSAGLTQLGVGRKIGYTETEINSLEDWIDPDNREALQAHMENGYLK